MLFREQIPQSLDDPGQIEFDSISLTLAPPLRVEVSNVAPTVDLDSIGTVFWNDTVTITGMFIDPGLSDEHVVTVDWADPNNAADSMFNLGATGVAVGLHVGDTFGSSSDGATLQITDVDRSTGRVSFMVAGHLYEAPVNGPLADNITIVLTVVDDDEDGTGGGTGRDSEELHTPTPVEVDGDPTDAVLGPQADEDWFVFDARAAVAYRVEIGATDISPVDLHICDSAHLPLEVDFSSESSLRLVALLLAEQTGPLYLRLAASASAPQVNYQLKVTIPYGDANLDGRFDSSDFVHVFQKGEYEDGITGNSSWSEGDWNGDSEFDSADFVVAFQAGLYETGTGLNANNIAAVVDWLFAQDNTKKTSLRLRESVNGGWCLGGWRRMLTAPLHFDLALLDFHRWRVETNFRHLASWSSRLRRCVRSAVKNCTLS